MELSNIDKKMWAKPAVQILNINADTYDNPKRGDKEVGKGDAANKQKSNS